MEEMNDVRMYPCRIGSPSSGPYFYVDDEGAAEIGRLYPDGFSLECKGARKDNMTARFKPGRSHLGKDNRAAVMGKKVKRWPIKFHLTDGLLCVGKNGACYIKVTGEVKVQREAEDESAPSRSRPRASVPAGSANAIIVVEETSFCFAVPIAELLPVFAKWMGSYHLKGE